MTKTLKLFLLVFLTTVVSSLYAQTDSVILKRKINELTRYAGKYPSEKVHIHLDRQWYGAGDTIWFKAYVVTGSYHKLSALSNVLYAELISPQDSVLKRLTLQLDSGTSNGDFVLPATYKSGVYRVRAYTNLMLNDSAYFFDQKVIIGGIIPTANSSKPVADNKVKSPGKDAADDLDIQFFPEGGDLINGLRSKVAFKAVSKSGIPENVHGDITDQDGNKVASFNTQHLGMGEFPLMTLPGKQYKASITRANGSNVNADMPKAKDSGFTLTINNMPDSIYVKVAANDAFYKNNQNSSFYLIAQSGGRCYYAAEGKLINPVFTSVIDQSRFPSGIVQFTLFSQTGEPLAERIIFVDNNDQLDLSVSSPKQTYAPRENVRIDLTAKNQDNNAVAGSFSVTVTDETKVPTDEKSERTILTDLLLTSELKGYIENPNCYFLNDSDKTRIDLDLLMLTQGYRRFDWKLIADTIGHKPAYLPQAALSLSGTIKTFSNKPLANGKIRITSIKDHFVADTLSDVNGNFTFADVNLPDSAKVIIDAKKITGSNNVKIYLNDPVFPAVNKIATINDSADSAFSAAVKQVMEQDYAEGKQGSLKNVIQLKEVTVQRNKNDFFNPTYSDNMKYSSNLNGPGNANQVLLGSKLSGCIKLSDCLRGRLFGVTFTASHSIGASIAYSDRAMSRHLSGAQPMALFIDGLQRGPEDIDNINADDVYSIEVLTSASYLTIYGSNASNGALIITLKRGLDGQQAAKEVNGLITYLFNGYYKAKTFYSPKYSAAKPAQKPDDRKTIYWNPIIITGTDGKSSFEYFNADGKGSYRVVVEGIDTDGNLGRQVFRYKVE